MVTRRKEFKGGRRCPAPPIAFAPTHVGSLVRPPKLIEFLRQIEGQQPNDQAAYEACLKETIEEVVRRQVEVGIDIVSDGEFSKGRNWAFYVHDRLSGVATRALTPEEAKDPWRPRAADRTASPFRVSTRIRPSLGPGRAARQALRGDRGAQLLDAQVKRDIANLKAAARQGQGAKRVPAGGGARERACRGPRTSTIG